MGMMRHGVAVDTGERPRVSAPGSTRQDRSDGPDETRSMRATRAKTRRKQPKESPAPWQHRPRLWTDSAREGRARPREAEDAMDTYSDPTK
jgi:hypothetical protein